MLRSLQNTTSYPGAPAISAMNYTTDSIPFRPPSNLLAADTAITSKNSAPVYPQARTCEPTPNPKLKLKNDRYADSALYEQFFTLQSRLGTFDDWPKSLKQKPKDLAEAGFFYLGLGDKVKCFFCGIGLNNWEEDDDPWEEHAFWYPTCEYLVLKKGADFVEATREKKTAGEVSRRNSFVSVGETAQQQPEENQKIDSKLCKICYDKNIEVLLNPCGHLVTCIECSSIIDKCPMCRKQIVGRTRAFLP